MLEKNFVEVYDKFKLNFYRRIFDLVREREGSLSAMEAFSLEVIKMLDEPTVGQFADFLNISQSNATYKVNSLIRKGYLERQNSAVDRREYHLVLSEKFYNYAGPLARSAPVRGSSGCTPAPSTRWGRGPCTARPSLPTSRCPHLRCCAAGSGAPHARLTAAAAGRSPAPAASR